MKRQETEYLRKFTPLSKLVYATEMKLRTSGQGAVSKIIQDVLSDLSKPIKYSKAYQLESLTMRGEDDVALLVTAINIKY